jgi:F-type H+-transporting ATPase subunit b
MAFDWWTLALQTANFAVLVWLLHRFLYKPVLRAIDARRDEIARQYEAAAAHEAAAEAKVAAIGDARQAIAGEREAMLGAATAQAAQLRDTLRAKAQQDAAALLDGARATLAQERDQLLAEARRAALDLAAEMAERVLKQVPQPQGPDGWLEAIERHLVALPASERDGLVRQLANGIGLTVVTASALDAETTAAWRTRLHRMLGDAVAIGFEVDPTVIVGAELHFPSAVLRFSGKSVLADVRREIEAREHAA